MVNSRPDFGGFLTGHSSWIRAAIVGSSLGALLSIGCARAAGPYLVQHAFDGADGLIPDGVVVDGQGNEYGATQEGGGFCPEAGSLGCGVVYKIDAAGTFQILVTLNGGSNGGGPSRLTVRSSKIYGALGVGGAFGDGAVFSVRTDGTHFKILHSFDGLDGYAPAGDLAVDARAVSWLIESMGVPKPGAM